MMLWANLHGNFTFGLVMIAPIARDALWRAQRSDRPIVFRQWFSFALLALGAACLNPYGPEMILVTFRTVALGAALTTVAEWRSQDFTHLGAFEAIMLGAFGFALYRGVTLPWLRIVMLFRVLHLALSQVRHADLLGMLAPIFLARPLAEQFKAIAVDGPVSLTRHKMWLPIAAVAMLVATTALASLRGIAPAARVTPANAIQSVQLARAGPILNDYDFGGYLDFVGIAPFIDGRAELYGERYVLRHDRALGLQNLPDFLRLLDEYCIQLRRQPLACSIGFPTGSARMPTSPSCTCVAELLIDTGKLPSTGVDAAPALVFNCIVWWPSSGTRRLRGKSHVIASFDHPHHRWGDRRLARWHHRQRGRFWPHR
jgi:hypothetical protein